jgi:histidine ammonia-lyase
LSRSFRALHPTEALALDGRSLTIDDVISVARHGRPVVLAAGALRRMSRSRALVDLLLDRGEKVYGLTTGFGVLRDVAIKVEDTRTLQQRLIRSHAAGVGRPFAEDVVRATLLLRANTLCRGNSGVRPAVVEALVELLNDGVYPFMPSKGSLGASGDLAPLSHLALMLCGDAGARYFPRSRRPAGQGYVTDPRDQDFVSFDPAALDEIARREGWRFRPVELEAKEGLALNNGTQVMSALACLILYDGWFTLRLAELAGAMSLEAQRGVRDAYDPRLHQVRALEHQAEVADRVLRCCEGSQILDLYLNSAHLQRAGIHLEHAGSALAEVDASLRDRGVPRPATLAGLTAELDEMRAGLHGVIPRREGAVDEAQIEAWAERSPREQIALFNERLKPLRQRAADLLMTSQQFNFPRGSASDRAVTELVELVAQLNAAVPDAPLVQDDYSFRCFPQVLACAYRAVDHAVEVVGTEINSATDNPLVFPPEAQGETEDMGAEAYALWLREDPDRWEGRVLGGGNFHGEPLAMILDYLAIALAEVANIAERRVAHLIDAHQSRGLPPFLIESSGLNSGFMIPQYTAASLVSENKVLAHPASVDSIPTSANAEDHVSMGLISGRKCVQVLGNVRGVIAIELLTAYQALGFREPLLPGRVVNEAVRLLRDRGIERYSEDRVMAPDIAAVTELLADPDLIALVMESPSS